MGALHWKGTASPRHRPRHRPRHPSGATGALWEDLAAGPAYGALFMHVPLFAFLFQTARMGEKTSEFYLPPPKVGKWESFSTFLWNSETSQFMGRTGSSWGESCLRKHARVILYSFSASFNMEIPSATGSPQCVRQGPRKDMSHDVVSCCWRVKPQGHRIHASWQQRPSAALIATQIGLCCPDGWVQCRAAQWSRRPMSEVKLLDTLVSPLFGLPNRSSGPPRVRRPAHVREQTGGREGARVWQRRDRLHTRPKFSAVLNNCGMPAGRTN